MIYGQSPTLLDVTYIRPRTIRNYDGSVNKISESFEVVYKTEDGVIYKTNEPAEATIYFVKPECRNFDYNKPQERIENLYAERVLISKIRYRIAEEIGEEGTSYVKQCISNKDWKGLNNLYGWRYSFAADFQPEFYYMQDWYNKYPLGKVKITKSFMDIEIDQIDYSIDLDKIEGTAYAPVNAVTLLLEETKESYTFILNPFIPSKLSYSDPDEYDKRMSLYEKQLKQHKSLMSNIGDFIKDLNDSFDTMYGHIEYNIRNYSEEIELIADVFRLLNDRKPNFCLEWNMRFDIGYLQERIKVLGYTPESIINHPDFGTGGNCYLHKDNYNFDLSKQFDYFYCRSYTQHICQMRLYASIRKSQHALKSVKLNDIGDRELGDKKVEYPVEEFFEDRKTDIIHFPYVDWKLFIKYNIKDVLITMGIERKTNDVMTYYMKSHSNLTPYNKIFRETHLLRNVREMYFAEQGWVQGNNINVLNNDKDALFYTMDDDEDDDDVGETTFKGAINAEPTMNDNVGQMILGVPSNKIITNATDYDMSAFYPSIKIISNMDPSTLIWKAGFNNNDFMSSEFKNRSLNTTYQERDKHGNLRNLDITGEAVNTYVSGNILTFGYNWLGYPSISEIVRQCLRELK